MQYFVTEIFSTIIHNIIKWYLAATATLHLVNALCSQTRNIWIASKMEKCKEMGRMCSWKISRQPQAGYQCLGYNTKWIVTKLILI